MTTGGSRAFLAAVGLFASTWMPPWHSEPLPSVHCAEAQPCHASLFCQERAAGGQVLPPFISLFNSSAGRMLHAFVVSVMPPTRHNLVGLRRLTGSRPRSWPSLTTVSDRECPCAVLAQSHGMFIPSLAQKAYHCHNLFL